MSKTIVWADDDIGIIRSTIRPLTNAGYRFVELRSVKEALNKIELIRKADLLLFDMILPPGEENSNLELSRYPGLDLLEVLFNKYQIEMPVVVLTVVTNKEIYKRLKALNVVDIINKPVRPSILKEKIERILGVVSQ
jgi:CheY-like chemotaxis protein